MLFMVFSAVVLNRIYFSNNKYTTARGTETMHPVQVHD